MVGVGPRLPARSYLGNPFHRRRDPRAAVALARHVVLEEGKFLGGGDFLGGRSDCPLKGG